MSARRRDTVADHVRALDLLVRLYEVHLEHVEQPADAAGWDRFGEARESIIAAWQKLTPLTTLLPDAEAQQALRDRMARLAALNDEVLALAQQDKANLGSRIGALQSGRRGLAGYRRHLGPTNRSQLGQG